VHLPREELDERFQQLNRCRSTLVEQMRSAATRLLAPGVPTDEELEASLNNYRQQLHRLQFELELDSMAEGSVWESLVSRLEIVRQSAGAVESLRFVNQLRVRSGDQSLLTPVIEVAEQVRTRLLDAPWQSRELLEEVESHRHPLCRLLGLLRSPEALSDDDWTTEMSLVQEQFGTSVATAIARGRVYLAPLESEE
jgi:hypothetical protein